MTSGFIAAGAFSANSLALAAFSAAILLWWTWVRCAISVLIDSFNRWRSTRLLRTNMAHTLILRTGVRRPADVRPILLCELSEIAARYCDWERQSLVRVVG